MISDTVLFGITLIDTGAVLFLLIYFVSFASALNVCINSSINVKYIFPQVLILSDLECDYINAQQCCSKLNFWSIPKVAAHVLVTFLLLITGHFWLFLVNVPFVGYLIYEYYTIPRGNMGIFDPAEIHVSLLVTLIRKFNRNYFQNRGQIKKHMSSCMIFLGFYLLIFFIYLYK